ncbi:MAG: thiolase family protein [Planctomycetes bacterium]|nr:thiolase family protein [Planctomycetota bacterium]
MQRIAVVDVCRTPIGKFLGGLSPLFAVDLGVAAVRGLLGRTGVDPADVEELIFGHGRQLGSGPNPARQVAIRSGLPETTPAMTLNKACGSSLKAIDLARAAILLDDRKIVVAGGMESMSNIAFLLPGMRQGYRLGHQKVYDGNFLDGFTCGILGEPMGMTAEYLVEDYGITRDEQDAFAVESHRRASAAQRSGRFADEIVPVDVPTPKGGVVRIDADEHIRHDADVGHLAKLPPVFRPAQQGGTVHAGNSSGITDGASAALLMSWDEAERRGIEPLAELGASAVAGCPPRTMGIGPVPATRRLLERTGLALDDFDLVELNEAFSAQVLAVLRDLPIPTDRLNVNGGAIALGHPIGATGARIVATLLHEMKRRDVHRGLATLCMSGGMGMSVEFVRPRG